MLSLPKYLNLIPGQETQILKAGMQKKIRLFSTPPILHYAKSQELHLLAASSLERCVYTVLWDKPQPKTQKRNKKTYPKIFMMESSPQLWFGPWSSVWWWTFLNLLLPTSDLSLAKMEPLFGYRHLVSAILMWTAKLGWIYRIVSYIVCF